MRLSGEIAEARERWAEQLMSDERLLGVLPEDTSRLVLDHALARLDAAAAAAASAEDLAAAAEMIRRDARALVDRAAAAFDPDRLVRAELTRAAPAAPTPRQPPLADVPPSTADREKGEGSRWGRLKGWVRMLGWG